VVQIAGLNTYLHSKLTLLTRVHFSNTQALRKTAPLRLTVFCCPSSYKMRHQSGLSIGGSGSFVCLIMRLVFDVASGVIGLSVS